MGLIRLLGRYGIKVILMSGFLLLTALCGTGCSEKDDSIPGCWQEYPPYHHKAVGIVEYDDAVSAKVFVGTDTLTPWERKLYRVILPDSMQNHSLCDACFYWSDCELKVIKVGEEIYQKPKYIFEVFPEEIQSRTNLIGAYCGTDEYASPHHPIDWSTVMLSRAIASKYYPINVYYHVVEHSDGPSLANPSVYAADVITELNNYFSESGIFFILREMSTHKIGMTKENGLDNDALLNAVFYLI